MVYGVWFTVYHLWFTVYRGYLSGLEGGADGCVRESEMEKGRATNPSESQARGMENARVQSTEPHSTECKYGHTEPCVWCRTRHKEP